MKVMFVVTHLLGSGHLARVANLARAFVAAGHSALIVTGGRPAPHLDTRDLQFGQLSPLRSDGADFTRLLDDKDQLASERYLKQRREQLKSFLIQYQPDLLITELFPFGRRRLADEFVGLLDTAISLTPRPVICASIRDILDPPSKPSRAVEAQDRINRYYDGVLVHSDPQIIPLDTSWPVSPELGEKLHYTGFVAQPAAGLHPEQIGTTEIVVSTGGGNTGQELFTVALDAARHDPERVWRVLVGGSDITTRRADLARHAPENAIVEPTRPDFRQILHHAQVSVSMCGYNTTLDILQSGVRAVCVPLDAGNEIEQSLRARAIGALDGIEIVATCELTPERLLGSIQTVLAEPERAPMQHGLNGSERSVEIAENMVRQVLNAH